MKPVSTVSLPISFIMEVARILAYPTAFFIQEGLKIQLAWFASLDIIMLKAAALNAQAVYYVLKHFCAKLNAYKDILSLTMPAFNFNNFFTFFQLSLFSWLAYYDRYLILYIFYTF